MEKTMVLMIGIPASGKSTFYQKKLSKDYVRVNLDTLKTRDREYELISKCFYEGKSFAIDDTNVIRQLRQIFMLTNPTSILPTGCTSSLTRGIPSANMPLN